MLVTTHHHELTHHPYLVNSDEQIWRLVSLELRVPYYLLTYRIQEGKGKLLQSALFWQLNDLLDFCERIKADLKKNLIQLALLSPSTERVGEGWQLSSIKEIWTATDISEDQNSVSFITEGGKEISPSSRSRGRGKTDSKKMLFSLAGYNE